MIESDESYELRLNITESSEISHSIFSNFREVNLLMENQDLLELVFRYLDPASVKSASRVSR